MAGFTRNIIRSIREISPEAFHRIMGKGGPEHRQPKNGKPATRNCSSGPIPCHLLFIPFHAPPSFWLPSPAAERPADGGRGRFSTVVRDTDELKDAPCRHRICAYNAQSQSVGRIPGISPGYRHRRGYPRFSGRHSLGKPRDAEDARAMLRMLSGRTHHVCTAVSIQSPLGRKDIAVLTEVTFRELSDGDIRRYMELVHVMDKAGAYAFQEHGGMIIASHARRYGQRDRPAGGGRDALPAFLGILTGTDARKHSIGSTTASPVHSERKSRIQFPFRGKMAFSSRNRKITVFPDETALRKHNGRIPYFLTSLPLLIRSPGFSPLFPPHSSQEGSARELVYLVVKRHGQNSFHQGSFLHIFRGNHHALAVHGCGQVLLV